MWENQMKCPFKRPLKHLQWRSDLELSISLIWSQGDTDSFPTNDRKQMANFKPIDCWFKNDRNSTLYAYTRIRYTYIYICTYIYVHIYIIIYIYIIYVCESDWSCKSSLTSLQKRCWPAKICYSVAPPATGSWKTMPFFHILGMSSSQLTKSYFSEG